MCRPRVLDAIPSATGPEAAAAAAADQAAPGAVREPGQPAGPFFRAAQLRHPAGLCGAAGAFVPNDVRLGGGAPRLLLLTGPNMGGKSTLLRQVCLAAVLAQVGAGGPLEWGTLGAGHAGWWERGASTAASQGGEPKPPGRPHPKPRGTLAPGTRHAPPPTHPPHPPTPPPLRSARGCPLRA
jgi:hypothetical protein